MFLLWYFYRLIFIEEQKLAPKEEVDMPVFFYIDPEFASDPWMKDVTEIVLHYTFFKSKNQT
jgi:cytochrome c oxidase assembly protein subunit 11